jgi:hypothetical protein
MDSTARRRLACSLAILATACGGAPVDTDGRGVPSDTPVRLTPPRQSVYLRASFDADPSAAIGRFLPDDLAADAVDENQAATTRCSRFVKYKVVPASGSYDETLNSSVGVSGSLGFQPVAGPAGGSVDASYSRGSALRVRYQVTAKMEAEIADADAFDQCCRAAPDQCSGRFVGEMLRGTGEVFQFAGNDAGVKAGGTDRAHGVSADVDYKQGAAWKRLTTFEDVYFAFRTQAASLGKAADTGGCGWALKVPTSLDGQYFVGVSTPAASEAQARDFAARDAQVQAVRYLGQQVSATTKTKSHALQGYLEDESLVQTAAAGVTRRVRAEQWCPAEHTDSPEGVLYTSKVLMFFPNSEIEAATRDAAAAIKQRLQADGKLGAEDAKALDEAGRAP